MGFSKVLKINSIENFWLYGNKFKSLWFNLHTHRFFLFLLIIYVAITSQEHNYLAAYICRLVVLTYNYDIEIRLE